jgi:hypothetical protein
MAEALGCSNLKKHPALVIVRLLLKDGARAFSVPNRLVWSQKTSENSTRLRNVHPQASLSILFTTLCPQKCRVCRPVFEKPP